MKPLKWITLTALISSLISPVQADEPSVEEYRAMMDGESPGAFWVDDGEELFYAKSGPKNVSLEKCDFGKGPGVIKGVYAEYPVILKM